MIERYQAWLVMNGDQLLAAAAESRIPFQQHDLTGVGVQAGMDIGMGFALAHPELARRLIEVYYERHGGMGPGTDAGALRAQAIRHLRLLVGGDA